MKSINIALIAILASTNLFACGGNNPADICDTECDAVVGACPSRGETKAHCVSACQSARAHLSSSCLTADTNYRQCFASSAKLFCDSYGNAFTNECSGNDRALRDCDINRNGTE